MSEVEHSAMRAGNADRERVVARLNEAFGEGRLDVAELDERVAAAYAAKTLGDLVPLTADLPTPYQSPPVPAPRRAAPAPAPEDRDGGPDLGAVRIFLGVFLVNVLIWAAVSVGSGDLAYFWPVWTAIPLVFAAVGAIGGRRRPR